MESPAFRRRGRGVRLKDKSEAAASIVDLKSLHAKIGELTLGERFFRGALTKADC